MQKKYDEIKNNEVKFELFEADDADFLFVAYGITSRVCREVVCQLRAKGIKAGLLRLITLWPFPENYLKDKASTLKKIIAVELSCGQMVDDVRLAVNGKCPVEFYGRAGGAMITDEELIANCKLIIEN